MDPISKRFNPALTPGHTTQALEGFVPHFQPIFIVVDDGHKITGFETLARKQEQDVLHTPDMFLGTLKKNKLLPYLDMLMFQNACAFIDRAKETLENTGSALPEHFHISVNISPETLAHPNTRQTIAQCLETYDVAPHHLTLEILEQPFINQFTLAAIGALSSAGHTISVDDYFQGHSNKARVQSLGNAHGNIKIDYGVGEHLRTLDELKHLLNKHPILNKSPTLTIEGAQNDLVTDVKAHAHLTDTLPKLHFQGFDLGLPQSPRAALALLTTDRSTAPEPHPPAL